MKKFVGKGILKFKKKSSQQKRDNLRIIWNSNSQIAWLTNFRSSSLNDSRDSQDSYALTLACKDEAKCEKVFNCASDCGSIQVNNGVPKPSELSLKVQSSGHVILYLTNSTNETIYPDLSRSFVSVSIGQSQILDFLSVVCGWIYFVSCF